MNGSHLDTVKERVVRALHQLTENGVTTVSLPELIELTGMPERSLRIALTSFCNRRLLEHRGKNSFFIQS